ncbi:transmembrane protein, putative (macronuclear) [Tetrahymena thermophila SB210]|uniref:Transmembrane protein, putative n=1 Tax=Tetrahymena thermophila (strain SB210) TaxID=312017 RepID=I7MGL9_TETTS|nr:transmembrane protein, putative [Tetrahymena thermophila SB210]EAR85311.2 transmembrane protein, putative [Tetrahymena thermophila SB210]|eukprot:XP_001032974.2 transmembrane protein, putative [Tetrahymena thermophila SB210]
MEKRTIPNQKLVNLSEQTTSEIMEQQYQNANLECKGFDLIQVLSNSNRCNYNELSSTQKILISSNEIIQNKTQHLQLDQTPKIKSSLENTEENSLSKSENKTFHEKIQIEQISYENENKAKSPKIKLQKVKLQQQQPSIDSRHISKIEKLKRHLITKLEIPQCKKRISYVKLAVLLSVFGILSIWALTIAYYFLARTLFINQRDKLIHVSLPMSLRSLSSTQMYYSQYIRYVDEDIFPGIKQDKSWQEFKLTNIQRIKQDNQQFDDIMTQIIRSDKQYYPYFQNTTQIPFTFTWLRDDKSFNRVKTNQTTSYFYFLFIYFNMVHRYSTQVYDVLNEEAFDVNNFLHFNTILTELQDIIEQDAQQNMVYITQNYQQMSYIVIAISCMILIQLLTIKYSITLNNQSYLKLITTFSPEALTEIRKELDIVQKNFEYFKNNQYLYQVTNNAQVSQTYQQGKNYFKQNEFLHGIQKNQKRKMISVTTNLPIFSFKLLLIQALIITCLVLPPQIVSYITSLQTQECQTNLSQMNLLYDMKSQIASNMYLNIGLIYQRMNPNNQIYLQDEYDNEMPIFTQLNSQSLSDLSNFMSKTIDQKRFYQNYYNNFFYKILKENICDPIQNFPQFTNFTATNFQYQDCKKIRNQILTKGFQISVTYFYDQIKPIYEILSDPQDMNSKIIFQKWFQQFNLLEFDQYVDYMLNTINILKNFIIQMSNDYLEYMDFLQIIIMISYNSFIIILCIFLTRYVGVYIEQESRFSKQILEIISLDHIISNNYIINQLQK